jgi:hypothetical protein
VTIFVTQVTIFVTLSALFEYSDLHVNFVYNTFKNRKCQWGEECILQGQKAQSA